MRFVPAENRGLLGKWLDRENMCSVVYVHSLIFSDSITMINQIPLIGSLCWETLRTSTFTSVKRAGRTIQSRNGSGARLIGGGCECVSALLVWRRSVFVSLQQICEYWGSQ